MNESTDELVPLAQVAKLLPPPLKNTHVSTGARWALRGVGNPPVKLETVKIGGRRFVTRAAVERFVARLTGSEALQAVAAAERGRQFQKDQRELEEERV